MHDESWSKVSVVLMDRQIARLDRLIGEIRRDRGVAITRAGLIRALIDGAMDGGFDVTAIASELEIRDRLARHLRGVDTQLRRS